MPPGQGFWFDDCEVPLLGDGELLMGFPVWQGCFWRTVWLFGVLLGGMVNRWEVGDINDFSLIFTGSRLVAGIIQNAYPALPLCRAYGKVPDLPKNR